MSQFEGIEVLDYSGPNYKALTAFGSWRVAFLNHGDKFAPERPERLERHMEMEVPHFFWHKKRRTLIK